MTLPLRLPRAMKQRHGSGGLGIEILYPGLAEPGGDSGIGAIFDHARFTAGTVVKMHPHRDDEILTYLRRGRVRHRDSVGHVEEISPSRLMMMNAGHSFEREEELLEGPLEAPQIFLHPRAVDLEPVVQFHNFGAAVSEGDWRLLAGPEAAPLTVRAAAWVQDRHLAAEEEAVLPPLPSTAAVRLLYVFSGRVRVAGSVLDAGDRLLLGPGNHAVAAETASDLIFFTTDPRPPCSGAECSAETCSRAEAAPRKHQRSLRMTVITHPLSPSDAAAMRQFREAAKGAKDTINGPEARPMFDELMRHVLPADGVTAEEAWLGDVPGWWVRPAMPAAGRAILYLHGGAYVLGSAKTFRAFVGQIVARSGVPAFVADYGLAPERPFPAAIEDARRAYDALTTEGTSRIALAGDSAGGGLALALLGLVKDAGVAPVAAVAMSPWTDLGLESPSMVTRDAADPLLDAGSLGATAALYLGTHDRRDPRVSPVHPDRSGLPPVLIHVGEPKCCATIPCAMPRARPGSRRMSGTA